MWVEMIELFGVFFVHEDLFDWIFCCFFLIEEFELFVGSLIMESIMIFVKFN